MGNFCSHCGNVLNQYADVCLSCGRISDVRSRLNNHGKALATVSVVFGSLGFYPLIFIGSIVGIITSLIGINALKISI